MPLLDINNNHRKTLRAIFSLPVQKNILWNDIESLFIGLGCSVYEGNGSRVAFSKDGIKADFHRPHSGKEAKPYQVKDAKNFLNLLWYNNESE